MGIEGREDGVLQNICSERVDILIDFQYSASPCWLHIPTCSERCKLKHEFILKIPIDLYRGTISVPLNVKNKKVILSVKNLKLMEQVIFILTPRSWKELRLKD